jgi:hypothetical protein
MFYAAFLQRYIYTHNPCGYYPSEGLPDSDKDCPPSSISIIYQAPIYLLVAISEILVSITSMEYAFTKAPKNMRSMIQAFALLMGALANVIGEGFLWLARDPLLVWNYGLMGVVVTIAGGAFWWCNKGLDWENYGVEGPSPATDSYLEVGEQLDEEEEFRPESSRKRTADAGWSDFGDNSDEDQETLLRDKFHQQMMGDHI